MAKSTRTVRLSRTIRGERRCLAVIGDIVKSREFHMSEREHLQTRLKELLGFLNNKHKNAILSRFVITIGDEFQGLLARGESIPEILESIEVQIPDAQIRTGIGNGTLETELRRDAIGMDGSAWHNARRALMQAKEQNRLGGVFEGFGADDPILNGLARLLHHVRANFTEQQRKVFDLFRAQQTQSQIARHLDLTNQTIFKHAKAIGWHALQEGESAWEFALRKFDYGNDWIRK
jgi:DNA-binding CsgD family transcriptional regulator